jgi:methyltransferase (TIGR00027 family)
MGTERRPGDTWDLATSVGATATMVAAGRARATNAERPLISDPLAEPLVRAVGIDFFTRWATGDLDAADVDLPEAPWGMQPMTDLLTARTRYFDHFLTQATESGVRQVVLLASGLDARGYRMTWPTGTVIFEIDLPDVLAFKAHTLAEMGVAPTAALHNVAVDLRDDWPTALRAAGFDVDRPAAWIAEGLLPFLPSDAQDRLLDDITAASADGSLLASEVAPMADQTDAPPDEPPPDEPRPIDPMTQRWREHGFDVEFGDLGYPGARNDVIDYLAARGWRSERTLLRTLLTEHGLPVPSSAGRLSIGDNYYAASRRVRD